MLVRTATVNDVDGMMALDYRYYPKEWQVDKEYVKRVFQKGEQLARVVETADGIKGYHAHLPLAKEPYENMLSGKLREAELADYVLDYQSPKEVYLYSVSIMVDIEDQNRKAYTKVLIQDMPGYFRSLMEKGIVIKELGAIAVSEGGKRVAESIGYHYDGQFVIFEGKEYPVYRAQLEDLLRAVLIT